MEAQDKSLSVAQEMMRYYDYAARHNKRQYVWLKLLELVAAASIPLFALREFQGFIPSQVIMAVLGAVVVVLEGVQQLFQFHENWTNYRASCEALRRELFLYTSQAGPYSDSSKPRDQILAERVSGVTGQAVSKWLSAHERSAKPDAEKPSSVTSN